MGSTIEVDLPDDAIEIGPAHWITFISYGIEHYPDAPRPSGIIEWHYRLDRPEQQVLCAGAVPWWRPEHERSDPEKHPMWTLNSLEPLDLSPSVFCNPDKPKGEEDPDKRGCGMHGFIKHGRWSNA